ncbi:MAG: cytotoxin [Nitrospira sp. CG24E]|nr:MAG: cytotoxin [Nitrospira sp. CG24E]
MKKFRARYTSEAAALIRRLHPHIKSDIKQGIREVCESPLAGHPLHFDLDGYRSFRVRTYRIIYRINDQGATIDVVFVGARRSVYEELQALLSDPSRRN